MNDLNTGSSSNFDAFELEKLTISLSKREARIKELEEALAKRDEALVQQNKELAKRDEALAKLEFFGNLRSCQSRQQVINLIRDANFPVIAVDAFDDYLAPRDVSIVPSMSASSFPQGNHDLNTFRRYRNAAEPLNIRRFEWNDEQFCAIILPHLFNENQESMDNFIREEVYNLSLFRSVIKYFIDLPNFKIEELEHIQPLWKLFVEGFCEHLTAAAPSLQRFEVVATNGYPKLKGKIEGRLYSGYSDLMLLEESGSSSLGFDFKPVRSVFELKNVKRALHYRSGTEAIERAKDQLLGELELTRQKMMVVLKNQLVFGGLTDMIAYSMVTVLCLDDKGYFLRSDRVTKLESVICRLLFQLCGKSASLLETLKSTANDLEIEESDVLAPAEQEGNHDTVNKDVSEPLSDDNPANPEYQSDDIKDKEIVYPNDDDDDEILTFDDFHDSLTDEQYEKFEDIMDEYISSLGRHQLTKQLLECHDNITGNL
jgi:hypothetical protein